MKVIAAAVGALVLATIGLTAASTRRPATEHFEAMSTNPVSAVATLIARALAAGLPPVRVGIHSGTRRRTGDWFRARCRLLPLVR